MRKFLLFALCLLMGMANAIAQNQVFKAVPATANQNFKVAELQVQPKVSQTKSIGETYLENEAFYTTYDLQSNSFISNRMYQNKNGDVAVVAMQSADESGSAADRGTGYNFYKDGKILEGGYQFQKIEANATGSDIRTGWPSIAPYGTEGEIMVCHTGSGLLYYTRAKAGEGVWDGPYNVPNLQGGINGVTTELILSWPRIITTGANNETVHIFAAATTNYGTAQLYLRSSDLQNWYNNWAPCSMDNLHVGIYDADDYAVAANGNHIAVVYNNWMKAHTMLYKSSDNGNSWESKIIWENPIHLLDWETDEGTIFEKFNAPTHVSIALDKYGDAHVALSVGMFTHNNLGTSYSLYQGLLTDGVAYWYEGNGMPLQSPDGNPWNALKLWWEDEENKGYITINPQNFCAWMPPHNENGFNEFDASNQYTGSENGTAGDYLSSFGLSAYPSIAVDPAGNIAVAYSAPDLNRDCRYGQYYYRSIFVNYKPAGLDWTEMTVLGQSLYEDFMHSCDECTYVTAVSNPVNENEFWFSCLSDDTPGFYYGSTTSQDYVTPSMVNVFKFCPNGINEDFEGGDNPVNPEPPEPEQPSNYWTPDESLYANNMTIISTVEIEGVEASSSDIEIGAFCNGELRGSTRLQYVNSPANRYEAFLMVYGNSGDDITFRLYDHAEGVESELKSIESVTFEVNGTVGDVVNPYTIKFTSKHWIVDPSIYANNMTLISIIEIDGVEQYTSNLELGAFCNGELRGSERLQYVGSPAIRYECFLMIYGNSGDNITFRLYDHYTETESDLKSSESISFEVNATIGDVINPYVINFKSTEIHTQTLSSGWNWYSTYIINKGEEGLANLEAAVGTNGIQIKNQTKFVNQASGNWYGTLTNTAVEDMFMIQMSAAAEVSLEGYTVNPADYPIALSTNWKWISYPLSYSLSVEEAFANANPNNGDYIKSQKGFAQYYEGLGWTGTLKTMTPGMGYMYQNTSGYAKTLVYPSARMSKSVNEDEELETYWTPNETLYPDNMTAITTVEIDGVEQATEDIEIGAFCGDELRGSGRLQYVDEPANRYECFLMLHGKAGDIITFKVYDHATASVLNLKTSTVVTFEANGTMGDIMNPSTMNFTSGEIIAATANPAEGGTIEGAGSYQTGENVTLKATENEGYIFLNWTENGEIVSNEYEYTFVVESARNLVANFGTYQWIPDVNIYPNNMTVITSITIDNILQENTRLEIGAFCNDELRGSGRLEYIPEPINKYEAFVMIYGNDGDKISFKIYDHITAKILDLEADDTLSFKVNETIGSVVEPHNISFTTKTDNPDEPDEPKLDAPQNVKANAISTSSIIVTWDVVENATSYNVYRNDELVENVRGTSYMDEELEYNTEYCYSIKAINDDVMSDYSEEVCVKTLGEGVEELASALNIYPNPVNDKLYIETEVEIKEINVYTITGVIVGQQSTDNGQQTLSIDMSDLNSGVYFVEIKTNEGNIVKRIIKK